MATMSKKVTTQYLSTDRRLSSSQGHAVGKWAAHSRKELSSRKGDSNWKTQPLAVIGLATTRAPHVTQNPAQFSALRPPIPTCWR